MKLILNKYNGVGEWTGLNWLRIIASDWLL